MTDIHEQATAGLKQLRRISELTPELLSVGGQQASLLIPPHVDLEYTTCDAIRSHGLAPDLDSTEKELVSIVRILDPLAAEFEDLRILVPRTYVHSLSGGAPHVVAQAIVYCTWDENSPAIISGLCDQYTYDVTDSDRLWQSRFGVDSIRRGEVCLVMNRRVGGWDGSPVRPVVELLAGGGHVKTVWSASAQEFKMQSVMTTLRQELDEELGFTAPDKALTILGGFVNNVTNELVILAALRIDPVQLVPMQEHAYGNFAENVNGIYVGPFEEVMHTYHENASCFAGGERSRPTNFPSDAALMKEIMTRFNSSH